MRHCAETRRHDGRGQHNLMTYTQVTPRLAGDSQEHHTAGSTKRTGWVLWFGGEGEGLLTARTTDQYCEGYGDTP